MPRLKRSRQACTREGRSKRTPIAVTCTGIIQNASISEMASASVTTKGITNMNLPMMPGSSMSGRKAAMVVATEATTGFHTSTMASRLAARACWPRSMR
ncbi:hypothetical protein Y695_04359 [Hydrogenophaga sp. T4]|nr:hypothetical protein Y695_04359 [Hydrogenophaga sp. T4]